LKGEISDEEFMQGLSQEFASLPNAQGKFYYPGQSSAMTPAKVKAALSKVKKGGYSQADFARAGGAGIELGKGYGKSEGSKLAGELGRYMKKLGVVPGSVHRHPEHPPYSLSSGHSRTSLHYQGRAIDLGAYANEQGPILSAIAKFNKMKGIKPVELLHAGNEPSGHSDHVHVAYAKGGLVDGVTYAMLGERGREFVLDADSTAALEQKFPGFLDALNKANYDGAINVLRSYTEYERTSTEIVYVPIEVPVPVGNSYGSSGPDLSFSGGGEQVSPFDTLYQGG
jgi:hypothetical protein